MFYCRNCGKEMAYDAPLCIDCAHAAREEQQKRAFTGDAQNGAYESAYTFEPIRPDIFEGGTQGKSTRKAGLGRAIVGAVLAELAAIFMAIAAEMLLGAPVISLVLLVPALGTAVAALVLGIVSIRTFGAVRRTGADTPIATLIIGIYTLANSALLLMICLIILAVSPLLI